MTTNRRARALLGMTHHVSNTRVKDVYFGIPRPTAKIKHSRKTCRTNSRFRALVAFIDAHRNELQEA